MLLHPAALRAARVASWLALPVAIVACAAHGSSDSTDTTLADAGSTSTSGSTTGASVYDSGGGATNPASGDDDSGATSGGTAGNTGGDGGAGEGGSTAGNTGGQACTSASTCPGVGAANCAVTCTNSACTFTCNGENYDVNGTATDGCETADSPLDNHTQAKSVDVGSYGCTDGDYTGVIQGVIPSDAHAHSPAPDGFVAGNGDAPDTFKIEASGGTLCQNDVNMTLQINGTQSECYKLSVNTDKNGGQSCQTNVSGTCSITNSSGSYGDGSTIFVIIEKTCSTAFPDDATYSVTGHL